MSQQALIDAAKAGDTARAEEALGAGADVNGASDEQEWTALNFAAGRGDLEMVKFLVERGADVFRTGVDNRTPYKIAIAAGHAEVARFLVEAEESAGGDTERVSSREGEKRPYCKAYLMKDLRRFGAWAESRSNWKADAAMEFGDEDVVFIHQDLSVTRSMFHGEDVLWSDASDEWRSFCSGELGFKVPSDFDLIPSSNRDS